MKLEISKNQIMQGLNIVKQGVANRTTNPILKTILFEAKPDGWLLMRATNGVLDISTEVKAEVKKPGKVCVSDLVINLLPTFEDAIHKDAILQNPVKLEVGDKGLTVNQGKRKHRPVFMAADEFPQKMMVEDYQTLASVDIKNLIEAFQRLNVAVGVTEDRRILQGFNLNPHLSTMVSGDGTRVYLRENIKLPGNIANPPAKLIMSILSNLTALGDSDTLEVKSGGLVAFKGTYSTSNGPYLKWEIIVNGLEGDFPGRPQELILESMQKQPKLKAKVKKASISRILGICKIYADRAFNEGKSTHVTMLTTESGLMFQMYIPDLVEMDEPLECQIEGEELKYLFHPGLALEALDTMKAEQVELRFFGELAPFLILDGTDFIYLQGAMKQANKEEKKDDTSK